MNPKIKNTVAVNKLYKMPFSGKNIPHAVIEVNQKCNISCKACYKDQSDYTKPLEIIKNEIDFIITKRNLHLITLAGGEPTLHPELSEVIKYISNKGILVDVLSNGFALTDKKLAEYKKSKINKIFLHIDEHQKRPDLKENFDRKDLIELRTNISNKIIKNGIRCALEITLYKSDLANFSEFISCFFNNKMHQSLLVTCCTDFELIANNIPKSSILPNRLVPTILDNEVVLNEEVIAYLNHQFNLLPYGYIPSTKNISEKRWIFYLTFVIQLKNCKTKLLHTNIDFKHIAKVGNQLHIKKTGKYPFDIIWNKKKIFYKCLLYALFSLNPLTIMKTILFLSNLLKPGSTLNFKTMIFQQGPNVTYDGEIEYCLNCPDVTIKDNKLIPVCLADVLK
ncbi:MAG: radical SAM protein [Bacteroidetes bacterium]|nr:radical SAM protein [Bacteroidota bacterium]